MAGAARVEANLPGTSVACAICYEGLTIKCLTLKIKVKVIEYKIRNDPVAISTSITVIFYRFSRALTVFEIFTFQNS